VSGATTRGLPYPTPTDDLRNGADAIKALADALDPTEVEWHSVPASGAGATIEYAQIGPFVCVRVGGSGTTSGTSNTVIAATAALPIAARPGINLWSGGYVSGGGGWVGVNSNGALNLRQESGASRTGSHSASVFYFAG
jgi:hypothetical protein